MFFVLSPGVVTILCHGEGLLPLTPNRESLHFGFDPLFALTGETVHSIEVHPYTTSKPEALGPAPVAENDHGTTPEEMPVTINVLENDRRGSSDDGDDDDDDDDNDTDDEDDNFSIDRSTVDLDPDVTGRQSSRTTGDGTYTVNDGLVTFSPVVDFFGNTSIEYTVDSRAGETSNRATLSLTVINVNDAPSITGLRRGTLEARAGEPLSITADDLLIEDPDNQMTADFDVTVLEGDDYTSSGNTVTPGAAFSGSLPVRVQVSDGLAPSQPFTVTLNVTKDNTPPAIGGQTPDPLVVSEDQAITIATSHLVITDPDEGETFTISNVAGGENYSVSGQTVTPAPDYTGPLIVNVTVSDGEANSEAFPLEISVTAVNDPPAISGQTPDPMTTGHNQPLTIGMGNLIVSDPDDTEFQLEILDGANYTVSGNTITPTSGFSGPLSVSVTVSDGEATTGPQTIRVSVAGNSAPQITGQATLSTNEETPLTIGLADLVVSDADDTYPDGFSLRLLAGDNYTVAGAQITPAVNFAGPLTVPVIVNDGTNDSEPFNLQVTVQGVNDPPVITGQQPLSTPENQAITLALSHLTVSDPDNIYPQDFNLSVLGGSNYSVSGDQITPSPGFNGPLTVRVFVNDGLLNSEFYNVQITVTPVNNAPAITGQRSLEIAEGTSIVISLPDVTVTDPDNTYPDGFTISVLPGDNYVFSGTTVTPSADFNGPLTVNVVVNDGISNSASFPLQVSVLPVNDAPRITGQQAVSTTEDVSRTIALTDLIITDPDNTNFTLMVFPGDNYTLSGNTLTPVQNFAGSLSVPVQVSDGLLNSNVHVLAVQVTPVNDPPIITGQTPVATAEDTPVTLQLAHLTVLDVDNVYPAGFSLIISNGSNYTVSGSTIIPATDFNGTLNVSLMVNDGVSNSAPFIFQIQVGDANDAPVVVSQTPLTTDEETAVTLQLSHLVVTDPDNVYPNGFSMLISPGVNYTVSGQTVTPALNFAGVLTIPVRVNDGVNNSGTFDFKLQVNQVNDAPSFAPIPNQKLTENAAAGSITISDISKGPMENDQQLTFVATSSNTAVIENPVIQYDGTAETAVLSYVVKPNASGVVTLTIVAIDNGSNTPPHENSYTSSFQVEVLEINTAPTLDAINNITLLEDAEQQNIALAGITAGVGETQEISIAVTASKPDFFELLEVAYTSPQQSGLLQFKLHPNVFGSVNLSVVVTDNGSGVSPHVNSTTRTFTVVVQPVNDQPAFLSTPVVVAAVNEDYEYRVSASDPDKEKITLAAPVKPAWASLVAAGEGQAILKGKPSATSVGNVPVTLQVKDATATVEQSFSIYVNVRPELTSLAISTEEDHAVTFPTGLFNSGYTDANENQMVSIQVTTIPVSGALSVAGVGVKVGDTIAVTSLSQLLYTPNPDFSGTDFFGWNASDGYHSSLTPARVDISVLAVNDPPEIVFHQDTLLYEVNGEPALLAPLIDIVDPDDDTLTHATIGFHAGKYSIETDLLSVGNSGNIKASYDFQAGVLQLTGVASIEEYKLAIRSITYLHQNTIDPLLEPRLVYFIVNDGETESVPKDKVIMLQYTFVEFDIPSGFTPNGDQANDTWIIDRPGGGLEEMDNAIISVYNKQGVLVFRTKGFERPWDGTMNGALLPADSYYFTIDLQLRNKKTYKGVVTILR